MAVAEMAALVEGHLLAFFKSTEVVSDKSVHNPECPKCTKVWALVSTADPFIRCMFGLITWHINSLSTCNTSPTRADGQLLSENAAIHWRPQCIVTFPNSSILLSLGHEKLNACCRGAAHGLWQEFLGDSAGPPA